MNIINMVQVSKTQIMQAAQILTDSLPIGWPTLQDAIDEIKERSITISFSTALDPGKYPARCC